MRKSSRPTIAARRGPGAELADRFEAAAQQLESLHRSYRRAANRRSDGTGAQANELREKLDQIETVRQLDDWHRKAERLLGELETRGLVEESRELLAQALQESRQDDSDPHRGWKWSAADERFKSPDGYGVAVNRVVGELAHHSGTRPRQRAARRRRTGSPEIRQAH